MEPSQRGELTKGFRRSSGSFELVMSPLLLALIGYGLDRWFGTLPVLTVVFAVVGFAGAAVKLYYSYKYEMERHEAEASWAKQS